MKVSKLVSRIAVPVAVLGQISTSADAIDQSGVMDDLPLFSIGNGGGSGFWDATKWNTTTGLTPTISANTTGGNTGNGNVTISN